MPNSRGHSSGARSEVLQETKIDFHFVVVRAARALGPGQRLAHLFQDFVKQLPALCLFGRHILRRGEKGSGSIEFRAQAGEIFVFPVFENVDRLMSQVAQQGGCACHLASLSLSARPAAILEIIPVKVSQPAADHEPVGIPV